ncbi:MAG: methyltransferase domain-containing protein [Actinomycetota bacterium]
MPQPHVSRNRRFWDKAAEAYQEKHGRRLAATAAAWGVWRVPESKLQALGEVRGTHVLELGCGAAQWTAELAKRGARVTGIDVSSAQLGLAQKHLADKGVDAALVQGSAEELPLRDVTFDLVMCDHGALSFAEPHAAIPEVARVLKPGGRLAFSIHSPLLFICWNPKTEKVDRRLHFDYYDMRSEADESSIQFQLPYGEWIELFHANGMEVEKLIHLRPADDATTTYDDYAPYEWARRWPAEDLWVARKKS